MREIQVCFDHRAMPLLKLGLVALGVSGVWLLGFPGPCVAETVDTYHLTDQPGNWFRSETTGTPVSVINPGDRVDFKINGCCTNTKHTVTLIIKPTASGVVLDQDKAQNGTLHLEFDVPGVYVIVCKIHPYMTAVVAVLDPDTGGVPPVTSASLPFIGHIGVDSLPAEAVLAVLTTVAASDADKAAKWDILGANDQVLPAVAGIGEIWINTQFERVTGQQDSGGVLKPGTVTVVDGATHTVEREIDGTTANGMWNNPHNLWANFALDTVYNSNWFGKWINKIDRASGEILDSIAVGEAPTHIITIPTSGSGQEGILTIPLSADNDLVKVEDTGSGLDVIDEVDTGEGHTHPHGHWLNCGSGDRAVVPNVFKGLGFAGSVSVMDTLTGEIIAEFEHDANDPLRSALLMPIAVGECHVEVAGEIVNKAYVANVVSGMVSVFDVGGDPVPDAQPSFLVNIPVTLTPDGQTGFGLLDTLQAPIQTPVSPDGRFVATAVFSLTSVDRPLPGSAEQASDHVVIIDAVTDQVVAWLATPAGTHGVNWGARLGGGYYAYVTNQHANVLTVIDPDPNGDGQGSDAAVVGTILLANDDPGGVTDGTGGQGVKPLPIVHDGWIQPSLELIGTGTLSDEVESWLGLLTDDQKDPESHHDAGAEFIRGDVDQDGTLSLLDVLLSLGILFAGANPSTCEATLDVDDDGAVNLVDVISLLSWLFVPGSDPIVSPYPGCGEDPTTDELECEAFSACP